MVNYQQTKIYKIVPTVPHDEGDIYIGSTTLRLLCMRWAGHTSDYKLNKSTTSAKILFDKYGLENCRIELLENYPCNSTDEKQKKEGEYHRTINCVNNRVAGRTQHERYVFHRDNFLLKCLN